MNSHAVLRMLVILGIVSLVFLAGCGGGTSSTASNQPPPPSGDNPAPSISMITPNSAPVGGVAFTLVVNGSNFVPSSVVRWNGNDRSTAFVNSNETHAQISASDIATTGTAAVTVFNPAPGGATSNSLVVNIMAGISTFSVAIAPDPTGKFGKFAYVAKSNTNDVSMYTINPVTGVLGPIGSGSLSAGANPTSMAVDPSGKFAYVANEDANNVSMYTIDPATGALLPAGTVAAGTSPRSTTVDPSGKFVYVGNVHSKDISMYKIDVTTGFLTPIGTIGSGGLATSVAVHPSGNFVYVANGYPDTVTVFSRSASSGVLTLSETMPTASPSSSISIKIAIAPSGKFAFVASDGCALDIYPGNVSSYTVNSTSGALTSVGPSVGADFCTNSVAIHPSGKFVYVTNNFGDDISMFSVNVLTGALAYMGRMPSGSFPTSIAIDPSGNFAYVANSGSNDVSMYRIDASTGALTLISTIGT